MYFTERQGQGQYSLYRLLKAYVALDPEVSVTISVNCYPTLSSCSQNIWILPSPFIDTLPLCSNFPIS